MKGVRYIICEKYELKKILREDSIRSKITNNKKKVILIAKGKNFKEEGTERKSLSLPISSIS